MQVEGPDRPNNELSACDAVQRSCRPQSGCRNTLKCFQFAFLLVFLLVFSRPKCNVFAMSERIIADAGALLMDLSENSVRAGTQI